MAASLQLSISENFIAKKVEAKGKVREIVCVYSVLRYTDLQILSERTSSGTVVIGRLRDKGRVYTKHKMPIKETRFFSSTKHICIVFFS
jgi:hypothetical protein